MGELIGGAIVMGLFILFIVWKNKGKKPVKDHIREMQEQEYWAEREAEESHIVSEGEDPE